jgi:hypothetical protein
VHTLGLRWIVLSSRVFFFDVLVVFRALVSLYLHVCMALDYVCCVVFLVRSLAFFGV